MSSGLRIAATSGMYSICPVPKAGYTRGMDGITLVSNADAFPGTPFG